MFLIFSETYESVKSIGYFQGELSIVIILFSEL